MTLEIDIRKKLASFDLEIALKVETETLGLLGESGCGKSMTMRCVAGIETPDEGKIVVNGRTYFDSAAKINLKPQERKTALLFQNYMLFPHFTVETNIASGIGKDVSTADRNAIVARELERFGLMGLEKRYPLQLSGGQQQRVALARMLAADPPILMLDEPFSALDSHLKSLLEQNLISTFDIFHGTVLYVSHDIDEAVRFCDRIAVISQGHITEMAKPDDLVHHPQSVAGIKLSGCKNVTEVTRAGEHCVHVPRWGVDVVTEQLVPEDVKYLGIRAFYIEDAEGPGENNFRVKVARASDSRFDRALTLTFLDRDCSEATVEAEENEMRFLHQNLTRRVDKFVVPPTRMPNTGDEFWVHLPKEHLYLVNR